MSARTERINKAVDAIFTDAMWDTLTEIWSEFKDKPWDRDAIRSKVSTRIRDYFEELDDMEATSVAMEVAKEREELDEELQS